MRHCFCLPLLMLISSLVTQLRAADDLPGLMGARRIVFLGDSITYGGQYIEIIDAYLAARFPDQPHEVIDLGLPSETVSGLSEPGHAGGKFPRPDVHERLVRVLQKTKPDLVVACYGMNCGIYHPFSPERFEKFQSGITRLHTEVEKAGAKIVHVTPPTFDPQPIKSRTLPAGLPEYQQPYEGYNEVLDRYSAWLLSHPASPHRSTAVRSLRSLRDGSSTEPRWRVRFSDSSVRLIHHDGSCSPRTELVWNFGSMYLQNEAASCESAVQVDPEDKRRAYFRGRWCG
ncbi:MAG: GDSL-type esterase/lipase family protein [Myxococcales bacterium]